MLPNESAAVDNNLAELVKVAQWVTPVMVSHLQTSNVLSKDEEDVIEANITSNGKLNCLFGILKTKDDGWSHLVSYLRTNGHVVLADKLQSDADGNAGQHVVGKPKRSALEEFSFQLAQYYQRYYAAVPTMGHSDKHVKDVWVPLKIDSRKEEFLAAEPIDHVELLNRLKSRETTDVALIKGDPGMGKTTLAKKIAYDWAVNYDISNIQQFTLVLAVPLRSAGKSNRFDQLAIDYFLTVLDLRDINKSELTREIKQLKSQLLVILDGLDEYDNYSGSPFDDIFARPFQRSSAYSKATPSMVNFKLIITSRPYACERVQIDFPLLRFVILPLDMSHLRHFVQLYCQTSCGAARVTEYQKNNADLVIQVPLILTFVCYLADSNEKIPTNMTRLYDSFIRQMILRENRQEKLAESVDIQSWKDSSLVRTTSKLAYLSFTDDEYRGFEFSKLQLDKCHVTNDSFICGFLLPKFNFSRDILMAEFPHRSIQEFFAAIHYYETTSVGRGIVSTNEAKDMGEANRFHYGICSIENRFVQLVESVKPSLISVVYEKLEQPLVVNRIILGIYHYGTSLVDCSSQENCMIGQMLFESAGDVNDCICKFGIDRFYTADLYLLLYKFTDAFKKGLHIRLLLEDGRRIIDDWYLADNRKSARLVIVKYRLPELLKLNLEHIDLLILQYTAKRSSDVVRQIDLDQIKRLLTVTNIVIKIIGWDSKSTVTATTVLILYRSPLGLKLTYFHFLCDVTVKGELLAILEGERHADLTVDEATECESDKRFTSQKLKVTVSEETSQSTLIFSLMRLSLKEA